jgi:hypothetical protein
MSSKRADEFRVKYLHRGIMDEIVFRPRYSVSRILSFFLFALLTVLNLINGVDRLLYAKKPNWLLIVALCIIGFGGLFVLLKTMFSIIKRIRFQEAMVVEYYFRPPLVIEYDAITSMDMPLWLKAGNHRLHFADFENLEEIRSIFLRLRKEGVITKKQYSGG